MIKEKIVIYPETKYQLPVVQQQHVPVVQQQHVQPYYSYTKTTVTPYELEQEIKKAQKLNIDIGIVLQHQTILGKKLTITRWLPLQDCFFFNGELNFIQCTLTTGNEILRSVYTLNEIIDAYETL